MHGAQEEESLAKTPFAAGTQDSTMLCRFSQPCLLVLPDMTQRQPTARLAGLPPEDARW